MTLVLPAAYLRSAQLAPPKPTHRPDRGYRRMWFFCPICGQWRWVSERGRRVTCSRLCYSRLALAIGNERRGKCVRPGCDGWRYSAAVQTCSPTCARWLRRRPKIGRPLSTKPRAFDCVICHTHCERAYPSEVPATKTCSRRCLRILLRAQWLQGRLRQLFKLGGQGRYASRSLLIKAFELGLKVSRRLSQREVEQRRRLVAVARRMETR